MECEDAITASRNASPSLPESAELFPVTAGVEKSSLEECAKMEVDSTQNDAVCSEMGQKELDTPQLSDKDPLGVDTDGKANECGSQNAPSPRGSEAKGTPPSDEPVTNHEGPASTSQAGSMDTTTENKVDSSSLQSTGSTVAPNGNKQGSVEEAGATISASISGGAAESANVTTTDSNEDTTVGYEEPTVTGSSGSSVAGDGASLSVTTPSDSASLSAAVSSGSKAVSTDRVDSSSLCASSEGSGGGGVILTEAMLSEEQLGQERASREGSTSSSVAELHQMAEQQRYNRLQHLLERSTVYSKFLLQRMENQAEEERRAQEARKKQQQQQQQGTAAGGGKRKRGRLSAQAKAAQEEKTAAAEKSPPDGRRQSLRSGVKGEAKPEGKRKTGGRKRKAESQLKLSDFMDSQGQLKKRKLDNSSAAPSSSASSSSTGPSVEEELQEDRYYNGQLIPSRQPRLVTGAVMRAYQLDGLEWIKVLYENGVNGILADEMGLGKTIQCIGVIAHMIEQGVKGPFLVAAPLSTVPNWVAEFKRFTPEIPVVLYHGTIEERECLRRKMFRPAPKPKQQPDPPPTRRGSGRRSSTAAPHPSSSSSSSLLPDDLLPVIVTSYGMCLRDQRFLQNRSWKFLVVDEGHRIKNLDCKLIKALKSYDAGNRLLLTGTPLQNNLSELWSLLNFLLPDIFDDLNSFQSWFDFDLAGEEEVRERIIAQEKEQSVLATLHQILTPFLLRRLKTDVEFALPPKKEVLVYAPLTDVQERYYKSLLDNTIMQLVESNRAKKSGEGGGAVEGKENIGSEVGGKEKEEGGGKALRRRSNKASYSKLSDSQFESILQGDAEFEDFVPKEKEVKKVVSSAVNIKMTKVFMMLRKCCNHPYLLEFPLTPAGELAIDERLVSCCGKMLFLDRMLPALIKDGHKVLVFSQFTSMLDLLADYLDMRGFSFGRLDGTMNFSDRQEQMAWFKGDPNCCVFILSTRAGGLGINLTSADTVIIYDSDWNPQSDLQAMDRCHRIGQTRPVMVYRFVTGNTIDQRIVERASSKRRLEKMVIHKGKFKGYNKEDETLSLDDLVDLLHSVDHDKVVSSSNKSNAEAISDQALAALLDRSSYMVTGTKEGSKAQVQENASSQHAKVFKVIEERDVAGNIIRPPAKGEGMEGKGCSSDPPQDSCSAGTTSGGGKATIEEEGGSTKAEGGHVQASTVDSSEDSPPNLKGVTSTVTGGDVEMLDSAADKNGGTVMEAACPSLSEEGNSGGHTEGNSAKASHGQTVHSNMTSGGTYSTECFESTGKLDQLNQPSDMHGTASEESSLPPVEDDAPMQVTTSADPGPTQQSEEGGVSPRGESQTGSTGNSACDTTV